MAIKQKRCRYCKDWYIPEPNVKNQKACGKVRCRKARKSEAQTKWCAKNPGHSKGRYSDPKTEMWRKKTPDYQKVYRQTHPDRVKYNRMKQRQRRERKKKG